MTVNVPSDIIAFLESREGVKKVVYRDTLDKPTDGMGHLLTPAEQVLYPVGSTAPQSIIDAWVAADSAQAYTAALSQAHVLGVGDPNFIKVLTSVNFQQGAHWFTKFPKSWTLMSAHKWEEAAVEIQNSLWFKQTPVRVADFQAALRSLIQHG